MAAPPYMPFYVGDYLRDTPHLTTEQHGAYLLLLFACWTQGGFLPDDDIQLAAITRMPLDIWLTSKNTIKKMFRISGRTWRQKRVTIELERALHLHEVRSKAGRLGGSKNKARARVPEPEPDSEREERDSEADASPVSTPLRFVETTRAQAPKDFWKRVKKLKIETGAVAKQLKAVGRAKVDEALAAVERIQPNEPVSFFVACCQDRDATSAPDPPDQPVPVITEEMRQRVIARFKTTQLGDPDENPQMA